MSNIAQLQLRYLSVDTLDDLKNQTEAFPGSLSLVKENRVLYEFVEYADGSLPAADGVSIVSLSDATISGRWVAIDSYSTKAIEGTFNATNSWVKSTTDDIYTLTIPVVNPINNFVCKVLDSSNKEVIPQEITIKKTNGMISQIVIVVGSIPDCRFAGSYFVMKDKML